MTLAEYEEYMNDALDIQIQALREQFSKEPDTHTILAKDKLARYKDGWIQELVRVTR